MTSTHIKYRINSVTSESANYPASNLTDESTTLGWQSDYSPSYPQQFNIQFFTPIRTKTMRLVFHQYKIPSCVQIFVRLTSRQNFRKLGYIIPNDNSQSSYQHKQIKTLYFEFPCNFIKLVFYQNYKNEMNLFEQVALEELSVEGEALTYNELRNLDFTEVSSEEDSEVETGETSALSNQNISKTQPNPSKKPPSLPMALQTHTMQQLSKQFQQVYSYLQQQKSQAVQNEDFRLAASLKNVIQTFKQTQQEITNLQAQKQQALAEEDFDKCHQIKELIKKKREEFQFRVDELKEDEDQFVAEYSHSRILHDQRQSTDRKGPYQPQYGNESNTDIKNYFSTTPERQPLSNAPQAKNVPSKNLEKDITKQPVKKLTDHDNQILPAVRNKLLGKKPQQEEEYPPETNRSQFESNKSTLQNKSKMQGNKNLSKSPQNKHRSRSPPKSPKQQKTMQTASNQGINLKSPILTYEQLPQQTAQKRSQSPQQKQVASSQFHSILSQLKEQFKDVELQQLDVKLRLKLQSHFSKIEQPYWQMVMHKEWKVKKAALNYVLENVSIQDKQTYMAVMEFISFSINDPHPQVILSSLHILRKLIQQGNSNNVSFTLPHLPYFIETIVTALLNLINSTNKQLSQQAYNLYLSMGMISFLTNQFLVQKIIKHKQTAKVTPQYTAMKISLMISMIEKYTETTKHYKEILLWAIEFLKDPNNKVRSQASYVLLILVDIVGEDKIINAIKDKPQLLELFNQMLNSSQIIQNSRIDNMSGLIEGSRIQDRSKLQENSSLLQGNKSLSKQKLHDKNKSHLSQLQNLSTLSQHQKQAQTPSNRLKNPWTSNDNQKQPLRRQSSKSRLSNQKFQDEELQYSKESDFYSSSRRESEMYVNRGYGRSEISQRKYEVEEEREIRVLDDDEQDKPPHHYQRHPTQQQQSYQDVSLQGSYQQDPTKCDYCFMDMQGMDQRQHLLRQCKVLVSCQQCMGRIYLRQIIDHLLKDCINRTHHQQCKKCGLVFGIDEINGHVGQGMCRLQRGEDWERCQFCGQDVMASDLKWVEHAYKCPNLPEVPVTEPTEKTSQRGEEDY